VISNFQSSHSLWGENSVERERVVVRNSITCCGGKWNRNVLFNIWWRNERILSKPIFPPFFLFLVTKYDFPIQTDTLNKASMDCSTITTFKKSNSDLKHFALCQKKLLCFFVMVNIKSEISSSSFVFKPFRSVMIPPYNRHENLSKKEADMNHKVGGLQFYLHSTFPPLSFF